MDSVDRATLIDFALGRLNDAETAALARRAEEDSEFAQTLDALRRELATLNDVRPSTLFPLSRRAPQPLDLERRTTFASDAAPSDDVSTVADEQDDERVVFFAPPSGAVKVRRIAPVYPYYSDDGEDSAAESCALEAVFPPTCSESEQIRKDAPICAEAQVDQETQIDEEAQVDQETQIDEEAQVDQEAQTCEEAQVDQETQIDEKAPRPSRRFHFIPKFIASPRSAQRSPFVAKRARRLDEIDAPSFVPPLAQTPDETLETVAPDVPRVEADSNVDALDAAERAVAASTVVATPCAPVELSPAERRLAEFLGRRPTKVELDEYYWEPISETSQIEYESKQRASLLGATVRLATDPVIAVGRATLSLCVGAGRRTALGSDAFAATKSNRRRQSSKFSDMMISTVSGVLIAVVVVFPLMRLAVKEVFTTIAKSAVRKIGVRVPVSENAPQSDLLPFISEQLMFPRYETANPRGAGAGPGTHLEPATHTETLPPPVDASTLPHDPASTPPTLESAPADVDASLLPLENALE